MIDGFKYDLRLYVLVTSFSPLTIYMYNEGFVRFASHKYEAGNLDDLFTHLTNYSINKASEEYVANIDSVFEGLGSKWSIKALLSKYTEMKIDSK